jgi:hypothetical protein
MEVHVFGKLISSVFGSGKTEKDDVQRPEVEMVSGSFSTKGCSQHGHSEISFIIRDGFVPKEDVEWLTSILEAMVESGSRFSAGQTMQLGWNIVSFAAIQGGELELLEPDFKNFPITFIPGVDATLRHLRSQKDVVESLFDASMLSFPRVDQSLVVHVNYKSAPYVVLERAEPNDGDSGWWLSDAKDSKGANDPSRFTRISLYQLALDRPDTVMVLALPPGAQAHINKTVRVFAAGKEARPGKGSFLEAFNRSRA